MTWATADEWCTTLDLLCAVLWDAACDADPALRDEWWRGQPDPEVSDDLV